MTAYVIMTGTYSKPGQAFLVANKTKAEDVQNSLIYLHIFFFFILNIQLVVVII